MKRIGFLYEKVATPDNLRLAFTRARRGKQRRQEVRRYGAHLNANLRKMQAQLCEGPDCIEVGRCRFFTIFDPKQRRICAPVFAERILHHAVINVIGPYLDAYQIDASYACRTQRGTYRALAKAQQMAKRHRYYLKLDVHKYFESIDHQVLMGQLARRFKDPRLLRLLERIVAAYHTAAGKGLPIGSLTSQYLANHYLAGLDHHIKERMRVRAYARYMDDFVLWHDDKRQLKRWYQEIESYLQDGLRLELNPQSLNHTSHGMTFLGYRVFPEAIRLSQRSRTRFVRTFTAYERKWQAGIWSEEELAEHMTPLVAFVKHADTFGFRQQIIEQYGVYPQARTA